MTGVELIVAALAAGASAGVTETTSGAIKDAYSGLRDGVRRRLAERGEPAVAALDVPETDADLARARLSEELVDCGADRDAEILALAGRLLALMGHDGAPAGGYAVDLREAKGVQVGEHNTQTNTFS